MAKIPRKLARLFGNTPSSDEVAQFGSLAAGTPTFSTDPDTIQALSNWANGWYAATIGNNAPTTQDLNAVCIVLSYFICYMLQEGVAEWENATTYYQNSIVNDLAGIGLMFSLTDSNQGNNVTDLTKWRLIPGITGGIQNKSADYTMINTDSICRMTGTHVCTLPTAAGNARSKFIVKNVGVGVVTVATQGGDTMDGVSSYTLAPYQFVEVMSYGGGFDIVGW